MFKQTLRILLIGSFALTFACSGEEESPAPGSTSTDICHGKSGNKQYIPAGKGNSWTYKTSILSFKAVLQKDTIIQANLTEPTKYYKLVTEPDLFPTTYNRYNSAGELIALNLDSLNQGRVYEMLRIPATPVLNQTWSDPDGTNYRVSSIDASFSSDYGCNYSGLLVIEMDSPDADASSNSRYYYKKGLGVVRFECLQNCVFFGISVSHADLCSVSLK